MADRCRCCGQTLPAAVRGAGRDTHWLDDEALACVNRAHTEAERRGDADLDLPLVLLSMSGSAAFAAAFAEANLDAGALGAVVAGAVPPPPASRICRASPQASGDVRHLLDKARDQARSHGRDVTTVMDLVQALIVARASFACAGALTRWLDRAYRPRLAHDQAATHERSARASEKTSAVRSLPAFRLRPPPTMQAREVRPNGVYMWEVRAARTPHDRQHAHGPNGERTHRPRLRRQRWQPEAPSNAAIDDLRRQIARQDALIASLLQRLPMPQAEPRAPAPVQHAAQQHAPTQAIPAQAADEITDEIEPDDLEGDPEQDGTRRYYLALDDEIVRAPSIGPRTAARLNPHGITHVKHLLACDPERLSARLGARHLTASRIAAWKDQARLVCTIPWLRGTHAQLLVGAGYGSIEKILATDRPIVCAAVMQYATTRDGQNILRAGPPPEIDKIMRWIEHTQFAEPQRATIGRALN